MWLFKLWPTLYIYTNRLNTDQHCLHTQFCLNTDKHYTHRFCSTLAKRKQTTMHTALRNLIQITINRILPSQSLSHITVIIKKKNSYP